MPSRLDDGDAPDVAGVAGAQGDVEVVTGETGMALREAPKGNLDRLELRKGAPLGPGALPFSDADLRLCERAPPLSEVLPKVRLVVHQGGLGTATAALMAGTPQLVLPRYLEQHVTGYCLFKLGAGVNFTATKPLDPAAFGNALARLLSDPAPARRTMSLAGRFAFSDSDRTLSLILERCFAMLG